MYYVYVHCSFEEQKPIRFSLELLWHSAWIKRQQLEIQPEIEKPANLVELPTLPDNPDCSRAISNGTILRVDANK